MRGKKKRSTWGSINSVSRTKHIIRYIENAPEGRRRRSKTFYGTRKEAELEKARLRVLNDVGGAPPVTIGQAWELWYRPWMESAVREGNLKERSAKQYVSWWNGCEERWADVPIDSVRPLDVQQWLDGLSKNQAEKRLGMLKNICNMAIKYEQASENKFLISYNMPDKVLRERPKDTLKWDESDEWLARVEGTALKGSYILQRFGGLRVGESLAVDADHVYPLEVDGFLFAAVAVAAQMGRSDGDVIYNDLKTTQSFRTALVPGRYGAAILALAESSESGWLSDRGDGVPMGKTVANDQWDKINGPVPLQNLRNSWRTTAKYEWGLSTEVLEPLMGHKMQGVTGEYYLRPDAEDLARGFVEELNEKARLRIF